MQTAIRISNLNDFIFCPKSIYYHNIYGKYEQNLYHEKAQKLGKIRHESIDNQFYSTRKNILQSLEIFSEKYNLIGKLDIYDSSSKTLVERKSKINKIYDGYRYQVYAQYYCLEEMGYNVSEIFFYSYEDNKKYKVKIPQISERKDFEKLLEEIRDFDILCSEFEQNPKKCAKCIYRELCDFY